MRCQSAITTRASAVLVGAVHRTVMVAVAVFASPIAPNRGSDDGSMEKGREWLFATASLPPRRWRSQSAPASNCAARNPSPFRTRASKAPLAHTFAAASLSKAAPRPTLSPLPPINWVPSDPFSCRQQTYRCRRRSTRTTSMPEPASACSVLLSRGSRHGSIRPTS